MRPRFLHPLVLQWEASMEQCLQALWVAERSSQNLLSVATTICVNLDHNPSTLQECHCAKTFHCFSVIVKWVKPITRRQNFRLVQIETNCRRHFKVHLKRKISTTYSVKHCEKKRNCLLQAISPFLTMFSTSIYLSASKCGIAW